MGTVSACSLDENSDFSLSLEKRGCCLEMLKEEIREGRKDTKSREHSADSFLLQDLLLGFPGSAPALLKAPNHPHFISMSPGQRLHSCRRMCPAADTEFAGYRLDPGTEGSSAHLRRAQHRLELIPTVPEASRVPGPRAEDAPAALQLSCGVGFPLNLSSGDV